MINGASLTLTIKPRLDCIPSEWGDSGLHRASRLRVPWGPWISLALARPTGWELGSWRHKAPSVSDPANPRAKTNQDQQMH